MKRLVIFFLILSCKTILSQSIESPKVFSSFRLGILAGMTYCSLPGGSLLIEGKTNLTKDLNLKLSAGYSSLNKSESYIVNTYGYIGKINDKVIDTYNSVSYRIDKVLYDVFPVSLGFEYTFIHDKFSPYGILEVGYNYFTYHLVESQGKTGGEYSKTLEGLSAEYRNNPPQISEDKTSSYKMAIGIGTNYKLTPNLNLDLRYVYQYNDLIINTHQILVGMNF